METSERYKHLLLYPEDLNPIGKSKWAAMRQDMDEVILQDLILPKDWKRYEVIMFTDPDRELDKILWDKESQSKTS